MKGSSARTRSGAGRWREIKRKHLLSQPSLGTCAQRAFIRKVKDTEMGSQSTEGIPPPPTAMSSDFKGIREIETPVRSQIKPFLNTHI